ncbi:MAG: 30S ribosomal protein S12 methylthiotransferase RimO [Bacteroidales bacterium]|nr:30S ribosomal protein S12 methylthiotransferase RimO [Bacteroidales bacterium]
MVIQLITLGCSKNLVDSEYLLKQLESNGHRVCHDTPGIESDVAILNTCGFILDARQESIDAILHFVDLKRRGKIGRLIVMGCLSERYKDELRKELPEVDGFYGVWDQRDIISDLNSAYDPGLGNHRWVTTPVHYAFLKISEGCNRKCSFCAIPGIRGMQRSKPLPDLTEEAENLASGGAKELILIAQDLTNYGIDLDGKNQLHSLLKSISGIDGIEWIRLHYAYPTGFPKEVIEFMAANEKVCNYLDIPIQHINNRILRSMQRGHGREAIEKLLNDFRTLIPDVALRTTIMAGYPGETDKEFEELVEFVRYFEFDRLGVFPYSAEEGTPASALKDDVPEKIKAERVDMLMELQQDISLKKNLSKTGSRFKVIIDREEGGHYTGRTEYDSPEVDNEVIIGKEKELRPGEFYSIEITGASEFDLLGKPVD